MLLEVKKKITLDNINNIDSAQDILERIYGDIKTIELPIDIDLIIKSIDGLILSEELKLDSLDKAGFIQVNRDDDKNVKNISIWANPMEAEVRRRFTKAHEVGHLVFDIFPAIGDDTVNEGFIDRLNRQNGAKSYRETRANRFAAQLLMPANLVRKEINTLVKKLKEEDKKISIDEAVNSLASRFDTSKDATRIRLENLGIIKKKPKIL